tara:strand:+ start:2600 stop:5842 length:3243 start_codon:yes stop_codon:yes gene_type:complete
LKKTHQLYTSTNLESDLSNIDLLNNVIITKPLATTINALSRSSIDSEVKSSSLSVVGPFGSGKSTTVLVGYHYLRGTLPIKLSEKFLGQKIPSLKKPFLKKQIKVITGEKRSLEEHLKSKLKIRKNIVSEIKEKLKKGDRLVIIIDEFGKYLEYNADNPKNGDVYLLQQLAELAQRSEGNFILLTIRHQSLSAYFTSVKSNYLNEWKKIQGRFHDIIHTNSLNETLRIYDNFIQSRFSNDNRIKTPASIINCFKNNNLISIEEVKPILQNCFPLHPFTLLLMISGFKRFAQNERSIFTFLDSNEQFSINEWSKIAKNKEIYGLNELYDFISSNMRYNLYESDIGSDWNMIENSINNLQLNSDDLTKTEYEELVRAIKTIGFIQILGKDVGLMPQSKIIHEALIAIYKKSSKSKTTALLDKLIDKNILTYKKLFDSYFVWEGTDLNINDLIEEQVQLLPKGIKQSPYLKKYFPVSPMIAQKHLVETGTMRWASFEFCETDEFFYDAEGEADSFLRCGIINHDYQKKEIESELLKNRNKISQKVLPLVLMIGKKAQNDLKIFIALNELIESSEKVRRDKIARNEIYTQLEDYRSQLIDLFTNQKKYSSKLYLWNENSLVRLKWFEMNRALSEKMHNIYPNTPLIHNELVNKERPSPSANVGVKKFFEALYKNSHKKDLGIEGNGPEKSIYLNILQKTGMHEVKDGGYVLGLPKNDINLKNLWNTWDEIIEKNQQNSTKLIELELFAMQPPFGIKNGLARVLSIVKLFQKLDHISLYKIDGVFGHESFVEEITTDMIELLMKRPDLCTIRFIKTKKIHHSLFTELYAVLNEPEKDFISLLDTTKGLIKFVNRLSDYTKTTKTIGIDNHAVIQLISKSIAPESLIYEDIPKAFNLKNISSNANKEEIDLYIKRLKKWHTTVHRFDKDRLNNLHKEFQRHWGIIPRDYKFDSTFNYMRKQITDDVFGFIIDFQLKEFARRIRSNINTKEEWFESVVSQLAGARSENWNDEDYKLFIERIKNFQVRIDEAIELSRKKNLKDKYKEKNKGLQQKILTFLSKEKGSDEGKIAALIRIQEKLEKKVKNN